MLFWRMKTLSTTLPTTNIAHLNLSDTSQTDASLTHLSLSLPLITTLSTLLLTDNKITHVGMQPFALALRDSPHLKTLDLSSNQGITDLGAQRITASLVEPGCKLESLALERCNIGYKAVYPLSKVLHQTRLICLKISENPRIGPPGLTHLGNAIGGGYGGRCVLREFYAAGVTGKDAGCRAVAEGLVSAAVVGDVKKRRQSQGQQRGSGSGFGGKGKNVVYGPPVVVDALDCVRTPVLGGLRVLDLRDNLITNEGAIVLASVFSGSTCVLEKLFLEENSITDRGVVSLANALVLPGCVLSELALECNLVEKEGVLALERAFGEVRKRRMIKIRY
ncbi:UNVERIFIED_CONTAM: RNA-DNA hybrid ribonuclease [Siphonaria sp. JEL0065]|nr:RNA-DNA hybrid ribonuclease [Siphonaria sp. JEL0065]